MYNALVLSHYHNPYHLGTLPEPTVIGMAGFPGEGPYLSLSLAVEGECIQQAFYETYPCPSAIACGSWLTTWLEGKTLTQVQVLDASSLMLMLGGLPLGKEHAAQLAVTALQDALHQLGQKKRE